MRHLRLVFFALILALPGCAPTGSPSVGGEPKAPTVKKHVFKESPTEAETRLNRYFADVVSRTQLKDCLSRVQGQGLVAVDFTYTKAGENWSFTKLAATNSSLEKGQEDAAAACLTTALGNTTFPVESGNSPEAGSGTFVVRWTWPVPLPPTRDELAARMVGGGGGVGGLGNTPDCAECMLREGPPDGYECVTSKRGETDCRLDPTQPNLCSTSGTACLEGKYGIAGGAVMF